MIRTSKYILLENSRYMDLLAKASNSSHTLGTEHPVNSNEVSKETPITTQHEDAQSSHHTMHNAEALSSENILQYIAKNQKLKAQSILLHLQSINELDWNDKGNIIISSKLIPHTCREKQRTVTRSRNLDFHARWLLLT